MNDFHVAIRTSSLEMPRASNILQWNLSITTTFMIKLITYDLFNDVF